MASPAGAHPRRGRVDDMSKWIAQDGELAAFCRALPAGQGVALDTEFDWTRTFYPVFALLQIGVSREETALVDALAIQDWSPLAAVLNDASRPKWVFGGCNDLPILVRACGGTGRCLPQSIVDLQLSGAFLGESPNQALKKVISADLGIDLAKSETRSDWTQRPLSEEQLAYAADDVALLPEIAARRLALLEANGNLAAFCEEMEQFGQPEYYAELREEEAWRRLSGYSHIVSPAERARARLLATWRERTARADNRSRPRVFNDEQLVWMATHWPSDLKELSRMPKMRTQNLRRYGEAALQALAGETAPPENPEWQQPQLPPGALGTYRRLVERILGLVEKRGAARQIEHTFIASRREIETLVSRHLRHADCSGCRLLHGWRAELLQPALGEILT